MSKWFFTACMAVMMLSAPALGQSDDRPATDPPRGDQSPTHDEGARPYFRGRLRYQQLNPWYWNEASTFMGEHSPNRWSTFQDLPEGRSRMRLMRAILSRYHNLMMLRAQDGSEVFNLAIKRLEMEDVAWGLATELGAATDPEQRQQVQQRLVQTVQELVQLELEERAARIQRLRTALEREQQRLQADEQRVDALAHEQLMRWMERTTDLDDLPTSAYSPPPPQASTEAAAQPGANPDDDDDEEDDDAIPDATPATRRAP